MTFLEAQWPDDASPPGALHLEPEPGRTLGLAVGLWAATCLSSSSAVSPAAVWGRDC